MLDMVVIGGGPAGLSAAISARQRNNTVTVLSNDIASSGLYKASIVDNYPGYPGISGSMLLEKLVSHAKVVDVNMVTGRVQSALQAGNAIHISCENEVFSAKCLVLATGITQTSLFHGEEEFLGRGVSYCATCDGMLYRGKRVCAICLTQDGEDEADYLSSIGCDVVRINSHNVEITGDTRVASIIVDGEEIECSGVFIMRPAIAPHLLMRGLETHNGYIGANASGETNIAGVFAAGDCVGKPHQIAKAIGQGQVAALSASEFIMKRNGE